MDKKISDLNSLLKELINNNDQIPIVNGGETKKVSIDNLKSIFGSYGSDVIIFPASSDLYITKEEHGGKIVLIVPPVEEAEGSIYFPEDFGFSVKFFILYPIRIYPSESIAASNNSEIRSLAVLGAPIDGDFTIRYDEESNSVIVNPYGFEDSTIGSLISFEINSVNIAEAFGSTFPICALLWSSVSNHNTVYKLLNESGSGSPSYALSSDVYLFSSYTISYKTNLYEIGLSCYASLDNSEITILIEDEHGNFLPPIAHTLNPSANSGSGSIDRDLLEANTWYRVIITGATSGFDSDTPANISISAVFKTNSSNTGVEHSIFNSVDFNFGSAPGLNLYAIRYSYGSMEPSIDKGYINIIARDDGFGSNNITLQEKEVLNFNNSYNLTKYEQFVLTPNIRSFDGATRIAKSRLIKFSGSFGLGVNDFIDCPFPNESVYSDCLFVYSKKSISHF